MHKDINVNVSGPVQPTSTYKTVVLKGQVPFASQVTEPNTKYVIKHNFDLSDGAIVYEGWEIEGMGGNPSIIDGEEYWLTDYESGIAEPTTYTLVDDECFFVIDGHISDVKELTLQYEESAWIATKRRGYHARILSHYDSNAAITIPAGCLLEFDGGSISNGTLIGQNTILIYYQGLDNIFHNVIRQGTFVYNNIVSADEEDITEVGNLLKLKDRGTADGMGKIILRKNKTFAEQLTQENTIYVIQYDFDLGGSPVTIPDNCVLEFDGGSISNGSIVFNNTMINSGIRNILPVSCSGTVKNDTLYPEWFYSGSGDYTDSIQTCIDLGEGKTVEFTRDRYLVYPKLTRTGNDDKYCLKISSSNISLYSGNNSCIYTDSGINYHSVIHDNSESRDNVVIEGITFDQSEELNTSVTSVIGLNVIVLFNTKGVRISGCKFNNVCGVNIISVNGVRCENTVLENNSIIFAMNTTAGDYDRSAVYINDKNHTVTGNIIDVAGVSDSLRGGIETHGRVGTVSNNTIKHCNNAINIVSHSTDDTSKPSRTISNNIITDCNTFIKFWPTQDYSPIDNITISNNTCSKLKKVVDINLSGNVFGVIRNIHISNNSFGGEYKDFGNDTSDNAFKPYIAFELSSYASFTNFVIENNIIYDFPTILLAGLIFSYSGSTNISKEIIFRNNICKNLLNCDFDTLNIKAVSLFFGGVGDNLLVENNIIEISNNYENLGLLYASSYGHCKAVIKKNTFGNTFFTYISANATTELKTDINVHYLNPTTVNTNVNIKDINPRNIGDVFLNDKNQIEKVTGLGRKDTAIEGLDTTTCEISTPRAGILKVKCTSIGNVKIGDGVHIRMSNYNGANKEATSECVGITKDAMYLYATTFQVTSTTPTLQWVRFMTGSSVIISNASGNTASRPAGDSIYIGFQYFDTSLSPARPIYASAISSSSPYTVTWVDATGEQV